LLFLNEIGLDPGLDHLSAKKIIDDAKANGHEVHNVSTLKLYRSSLLTSWCGGLPAPECADNPIGYKFSWSPRGVLLAALNSARYRQDGKEISIPGDQLLAAVKSTPFQSRFNLEGIPNRDSLKYEQLYDLVGIPTMLRGTLRYNGFCDTMRKLRQMGLFSLDSLDPQLATCKSWQEVYSRLDTQQLDRKTLETIEWIGLNSAEPFVSKTTMLDSFCELLQKKLKYETEERDMVVMQHEFVIKQRDGTMEKRSSSLIQYGEIGGFSAMARTVGYPVAIAAEMILDGDINHTGVLAPLMPTIYNPMLQRLESVAGIRFKETSSKQV
jgi:saccharopine dehydrogenase-like NADP-dependent oxidoreductase